MARRGALIAAIALAVVIGAFVVLLAVSDGQRTSNVSFEVVGDVAPDIRGSTLDGGTFDLAAHRGDWVVVNFFASWCVGCRVEHPELVAQRLERFADIVGRERVIAGTDCGFSTFAGYAGLDTDIAYEKMASMAKGAEIASERLWG